MLSILARQSKPDSTEYSGERLVNYFLRPADGATQGVLLGRGGLVSHVDLGTGSQVRAMASLGGALYAVSGGTVWKVSGGTATNVGTVTDGETYLATNRTELAIVTGGKYYVCDGATTTQTTAGSITSAVGVTSADGYIIVIGTGAGVDDLIQVSAVDDATTFSALDFAAAEYRGDALVGCILDHGQIYFFGTETTEAYYNSGAQFPFSRNLASVIEHGCIHGRTIAKADNAVFWVRPDSAVVQNFGGSPQIISTPEVKDELARSTITGGFTFSERGHEFYAVTRASGTTWVYDLTTGLWHERADGLEYDPWKACCSVPFGGEAYFGCSNGHIATAGATTYSDFGGYLLGEFESPLIKQQGELFRVARLHIDIESGTGGIGRTPQAMLQTSKNGAEWSLEKWRDLADLGQYGKRATWHALGQFRQGKVRFRVTDAVKRDVIGGAVRYG